MTDTPNPTEPKRFYLSETDKKIAGVCGGFAEYFHVDAMVVRLIAVLLVFVTGGTAILAYLVMALVSPKRPPAPIDKK